MALNSWTEATCCRAILEMLDDVWHIKCNQIKPNDICAKSTVLRARLLQHKSRLLA